MKSGVAELLLRLWLLLVLLRMLLANLVLHALLLFERLPLRWPGRFLLPRQLLLLILLLQLVLRGHLTGLPRRLRWYLVLLPKLSLLLLLLLVLQ